MYVGNVSEMFVFNLNLYFAPYQISMIWGNQEFWAKNIIQEKLVKFIKTF